MPDFIDHPQYAKITAYTAQVVQNISDSQAVFFAANGFYFQGLWILGPVQVDGTTDENMVVDTSPEDQPYTWEDFNDSLFKSNIKIPVNIKIDVYQHQLGWGWILTAEVFYAGIDPDAYGNYGDHWIYKHHEGPRSIIDIFDEWHIVMDEE